ncbi:MAG: phospholipid carrier-dependent glycosyltransferase [Azonexus sp.]
MDFRPPVDSISRPRLAWLLAGFLFAALVLAFGIGAPSGLTGKDEYFLGLRIPLEMIEHDNWWIPFIDGAPRLRKPPFVYWLTRLSYEAFGPSLLSARLVTVAFALLLLGATAWLGRLFSEKWLSGLLAAGVMLGFSGMATESRRLMLDIPVAALSTAAFCTYLAWLGRPRVSLLLATTALLSAALMTKGPVALIAFGSGVLAFWLAPARLRSALGIDAESSAVQHLRRQAPAYLACALLAAALPAWWYWDVAHSFPQQFAAAAQNEIEERGAGSLSFIPLSGLLLLTLPWTFIGLAALIRHRHASEIRFFGLWLLISLLPFFFIRSFERYLIGALPAFALLCAWGLQQGPMARWAARLGAVFPLLIGAVLSALLWRWGHGTPALALGVALTAFVTTWFRSRSAGAMILAAALLWPVFWGSAFPALGVNAVPATLVELTRERNVYLYEGPQPALLPILAQRTLRHVQRIDGPLAAGSLITVRAEDVPRLQRELASARVATREIYRYSALTSAGSGIRFARQGATAQDWKTAWEEHDPQALMSTVMVYEVQP